MKKYSHFLITILLILSNRNLNTAPFDTGMIELQQPDETTFTGRIWGDEFFSWAETEDGYRFVQSGDGWYYYAQLDANGEFTKTTYKVGIDSPPAGSYQLERTQARIAEINQQIEEFNEQIELNRQWFAQKQSEAQGQPVTLKVGIILIEFADTTHYRTDPQGNRPNGYFTADFDSMMFSNNYWIGAGINSPHPEEEEIFGSFRDYWDQISRGKLKITGKVVNPDNDQNGVPDWLKASGTRTHYVDTVGCHILAHEAYDSALAKEYISEDPDEPNYYDKYAVVYALDAIYVRYSVGGFFNGNIFYLAERSGPNLYGGGPFEKSFTHIGTYLHEFGHNLGFYDEYNPQTLGSTDINHFCLMSYGAYNGPDRKGACPATLSPWYRIDKEWVSQPELIDSDTTNFIVEYDYEYPKLYRIDPIEAINDEHYIIESRNREGFDLHIPGEPADTVNQPGRLIIWQHNTNSSDPTPYYDRIRIKFADNDSTVSTQINDFFPAFFSMNNYQSFNDTTSPAATINDKHWYFNFPGIPAHFALNGIQKLANGNTLIDEIILNHPLRIMNINNGNWQTVSVPGIPDDYDAESVFPTAIPNHFYKYQSGYIQVSTLENGPGYYVKFPAESQTIILDGGTIEYLEVPLNNGWNLTGSISFQLPLANVCTDPPGILTGDIYYYDGGYHYLDSSSIIKPGIGYWIKTNNTGDLILDRFADPCELPKITSHSQIDFSVMDKFIITDSEGNKQNLFVSNTDIDTVMAGIDLELPPFFSELDFDSRFEYNEFVKKVSSDSGTIDLNILVHTNSYPVSLAWELNPENNINYSFMGDTSLGRMVNIGSTTGNISFNSLVNNKIRLAVSADKSNTASGIPTEYSLHQNYPNPFNPNTIIKYDLPEASDVSLIIYDILGRKVKELVNTKQQAGRYKVLFSASTLASGVYVYQLRADKYISSKKMILLK